MKYTDLSYLLQRTKNNSGVIMEFISAYLEQTPPLINTMNRALQDKDWNTLHAAVHKMTPSFSIMGMNQDYEKTAKKVLEYSQSQSSEEDISNMVQQLDIACRRACEELELEFNRLKNIIS